jgi:hypothetical protein
MDPDPDSEPDLGIFVIDLQDANRTNLKKTFFCLLLSEGSFTSFFKGKSTKEITKH